MTTLTGIDGDEIIKESMEKGNGVLRVLQVSPKVLGRYIKVASEEDESVEKIRVLSGSSALKDAMDDFLIASAASDLIEDGKLELLTTDDNSYRSLVVVGDSDIMSFVDVGDRMGALSTDEPGMVEDASGFLEELWEKGDDFVG
jgi:hypothetical protein